MSFKILKSTGMFSDLFFFIQSAPLKQIFCIYCIFKRYFCRNYCFLCYYLYSHKLSLRCQDDFYVFRTKEGLMSKPLSADRRNMILSGNLIQAILMLAIPVMINSFIQSMYNLTDTFWLGRIGTESQAAITLVLPDSEYFNKFWYRAYNRRCNFNFTVSRCKRRPSGKQHGKPRMLVFPAVFTGLRRRLLVYYTGYCRLVRCRRKYFFVTEFHIYAL